MDLAIEIMALRSELQSVCSELQSTRSELQSALAEIKRLKDLLAKNSRNSSKPPSTDGFKKEKPCPKSQREQSGKHTGGQPGHEGHKLKRVEIPDEISLKKVVQCSHCQNNLSHVLAHDVKKRQIFDIPPMDLHVTEHQAEVKICPHCLKETCADFPEGLVQEAQYGHRIKALVTYLSQYQMIPYDRIQQFFEHRFDHIISEGTIDKMIEGGYNSLEEIETIIKAGLIQSVRLHHDETGLRVVSDLYWQHVASTEKLTHYAIHKKRGHEAIEATGILPHYEGTLVHDQFSPYAAYGKKHLFCNAHHLRELTFIEEQHHQEWARHMKDLLLAIKNQRDVLKTRGENAFPDYRLSAYLRCYDDIIMKGLWHPDNLPKIKDDGPTDKKKQGINKQTKAKNLLDRLRHHKDEVLGFMYDFDAPFDNNLAERDLRMSKVKQKVSGCFRSEKGAKRFCRIRSYISTARKNGIQILDALEKAFLGNPFNPCPTS